MKYQITVGEQSIVVNAGQFRRLSAMMDSRTMGTEGDISIFNVEDIVTIKHAFRAIRNALKGQPKHEHS